MLTLLAPCMRCVRTYPWQRRSWSCHVTWSWGPSPKECPSFGGRFACTAPCARLGVVTNVAVEINGPFARNEVKIWCTRSWITGRKLDFHLSIVYAMAIEPLYSESYLFGCEKVARQKMQDEKRLWRLCQMVLSVSIPVLFAPNCHQISAFSMVVYFVTNHKKLRHWILHYATD